MQEEQKEWGFVRSVLLSILANQKRIISLLGKVLTHQKQVGMESDSSKTPDFTDVRYVTARRFGTTVGTGDNSPPLRAAWLAKRYPYSPLDEYIEVRGGLLAADSRELVVTTHRPVPLTFREFVVLKELAKQRLAPSGETETEKQGFVSADKLADRIDKIMQGYDATESDEEVRWSVPTPEDVRKAVFSIRAKLAHIDPDLIETAADRGSGYRLRVPVANISIVPTRGN